MALNRHLKMGMVGGGPGAFIGDVHRKASRLDGGIDLVAGAFDINPRKSKQMGRELLLDSKRVYGTYEQMIEKELKLPDGERIDLSRLLLRTTGTSRSPGIFSTRASTSCVKSR